MKVVLLPLTNSSKKGRLSNMKLSFLLFGDEGIKYRLQLVGSYWTISRVIPSRNKKGEFTEVTKVLHRCLDIEEAIVSLALYNIKDLSDFKEALIKIKENVQQFTQALVTEAANHDGKDNRTNPSEGEGG